MNNYLNYLVEANFSLVIFFTAYTFVLRKETDFKVQRLFLLAGVITALLFPLVHISYSQPHIPSLSDLIPSYLLPELTIGDHDVVSNPQSPTINPVFVVQVLYIAGFVFFLARFVLQLILLIRRLSSVASYKVGGCKVVESVEYKHTFSFFKFIFLGQSDGLTADDKTKIIQHETVHARQFHSCDLLLINVVGIFFWFNPILRLYKKTFIQLHEFEADARSVDNRDANVYCSLLAKVALQSADFPLANHFNSSLTLKRIAMMRTIKQKTKRWKMIVVASVIPIVFFIVACQDQVATEAQKLVKSTTMAVDIPPEIQSKIDELENTKPEKEFVVIETTTAEGMATLEKLKDDEIASMNIITPTAKPNEPVRTFVIVELNSLKETRADPGDKIYDVVDETAMPEGGLSKFYEYVAKNLRYPAEARMKGIEGKVFVDFVVDINGDIDVTGISGIGADCDLEAMRVIQSSPKWIPGRNNGIPVKQKMVLPINFSLAGSTFKDAVKTSEGAMAETVVVGHK